MADQHRDSKLDFAGADEIEAQTDGALAGPPPGVYACEDEYYEDIAKGWPKLKAWREAKLAEQAAEKQAKSA